jgi:hypothetical protein
MNCSPVQLPAFALRQVPNKLQSSVQVIVIRQFSRHQLNQFFACSLFTLVEDNQRFCQVHRYVVWYSDHAGHVHRWVLVQHCLYHSWVCLKTNKNNKIPIKSNFQSNCIPSASSNQRRKSLFLAQKYDYCHPQMQCRRCQTIPLRLSRTCRACIAAKLD